LHSFLVADHFTLVGREGRITDTIHVIQENGGVHRRVVAAITVEAPIENLWSVLTSYEQLPE
jgi:uncharacterized membrane protein